MIRSSRVRIRVITKPADDAPRCIVCEKPATYPKEAVSPRFCKRKCAAFYGVVIANDWAWCRTHRSYWDRLLQNGCDLCPERPRRAGSPSPTIGDMLAEAVGIGYNV